MALDSAGKLYTWGCPEQNQLGRRCVQRELLASALRPGGVGLKRGVKVVKISCGSYHSFAVDKEGGVYTWGLNNFGQLAIEQDAGDSDAAVLTAVKVESLMDYKIVDIAGGEHHSLACTDDGRLLVWGRIDGHQTGLPFDSFTEENAIYDDYKKPRILKTPTVIPGMSNLAYPATYHPLANIDTQACPRSCPSLPGPTTPLPSLRTARSTRGVSPSTTRPARVPRTTSRRPP